MAPGRLILVLALMAQALGAQTGNLEKDIGVVRRSNAMGQGTRWAVVIGLDDYEDAGIPNLKYCEKDARDVSKVLTDTGWRVTLVTMAASPRPTRGSIRTQIEKVCRRAKSYDTILVYFSGHGFSDPKGENYLCTLMTDLGKLELTAVSVAEVMNTMRQSGAKKLAFVVDACRNQAGAGKSIESAGFTKKKLDASEGLGLLFGTAPGEKSFEPFAGLTDQGTRAKGDEPVRIENGVMTHFLLRGLRGEARTNDDNFITFRELSYWVGRKMGELNQASKDVDQVPFFRWQGGADHDILMRSLPGSAAPAGFELIGKNRQGYEEFTHTKSGMTFILIPGGTFPMGSAEGDPDEKPVREVTLSPYYLSKFEVTNAQYAQFCEATGHGTPAEPRWKAELQKSFTKCPDHPVVNVSWKDAQAFCKWAGFILPTEAQWEFAARGEDGRKFPWGESSPSAEQAHFGKATLDGTVKVGSLKRGSGPFGALDQAGNVFEWCLDWHSPSYDPKSTMDPQGANSGTLKVFRGGGYPHTPAIIRSANRAKASPRARHAYIGFRPAFSSNVK